MAKYSTSSYDDYFCLKPPLLLWMAAIYLSRAIALPLAVGVGRFAGVGTDATQLLQGMVSIETVLPSALAIGVLYAMCRRLPSASSPVRWLWAHGRMLLALAAAADCGLSIYALARLGVTDGQPLPLLFIVAFDLYFLVYVLMARRVRDTFSDFPQPLAAR